MLTQGCLEYKGRKETSESCMDFSMPWARSHIYHFPKIVTWPTLITQRPEHVGEQVEY